MPTISVVIPTRDRPEFVRQALRSLLAQRFEDFEVVVADNPVTAPSEEVVAEFEDERIRYLRAERPLSMHDNWEAGCAGLRGDYVAVMIDKTVWLPSTMGRALGILEETSASVVSWWDSSFEPDDERSSLTEGAYYAYRHPPSEPTPFSGAEELSRAMAFDVRRGLEGPSYFRGKICFGLYRRDILDGIRDRIGRLFPPICPDYTSRTAALSIASTFVDAGVPLQLSFSSETSTGRQQGRDPLFAKRFLDEIDPGLVEQLPIPGVFASHHNIVAHDYLLAERLGEGELDRLNLANRAREDLDETEWPDEELRREQYRLVAQAERRAGRSRMAIQAGRTAQRLRVRGAGAGAAVREAAIRLVQRMPPLHRAVRRALGRPPGALEPEASSGTLSEAILAAESRLTAAPHD
jgi:hypothetical protein